MPDQFYLLKTQRFLPLFITQFLGAFNDNFFKNALVILITYKIAIGSEAQQQFLVTLAAGIFILPFFLFSALAGQLADKYNKAVLIQIIKAFEISFITLGAIGFYNNSLILLITTLFLMGTHSTFFGPLKYAILPNQLHENELINGNALIEAGTFIAILLGTIFGGTLIITQHGNALVSTCTILFAIIGLLSSLFIPHTTPAQANLNINLNIFSETLSIIRNSREQKIVFLTILGLSWFWLVGAIFLAQLPNLAKNILHAGPHVVTLFLTTFSVGIAIGALACNKLLKDEITAKYVPVSILAMSFFILDFYVANTHFTATTLFPNVIDFLASFNNWRILFDMFLLAMFGGIYTVPLYAIMQARSAPESRARTIACNNILNALFMVMSAASTLLLFTLQFTVIQVFLLLGILNIIIAIYICKLLPHALVQSFVKWLLQAVYKVKVVGIENYKAAGERTIIIANHTSFLDVALLIAFLPDKLMFAINTHVAQIWWLKPLLSLVDVFELDPTNPIATKLLIKAVKKNNRCVIFPEGRLTTTGTLMKIYEGPGLIADHSHAPLLPIRIDGTQYTHFARLHNKVHAKLFPKITITIQPPQVFNIDSEIKGRQRRQYISAKVYDIMTDMMFDTCDYHKTLFESLLDARKIHRGNFAIVEDINRKPITYNQLITHSLILGKQIQKNTYNRELVGVLLPNIISCIVTFFALQAFNRIPVMLNYLLGTNNLLSACHTAKIKTVYSSLKFIESANLANTINKLTQAGVNVIYLENLHKKISWLQQLNGTLISKLAKFYYQNNNLSVSPTDPAVVLFTSGSEGTPKGVILSHENILANCFQVRTHVDFNSRDILFNALPIYHSFGLTMGMLLPILAGIKLFLYPSPLHYRIVPEMIYDTNATILFGTETFLSGYGRFAHPYDFYSIRHVFAGAEKLKSETRKLWMEKFGVRIFEGYGVTETSPVLAVNTPMHNKAGTVGRLMPHIKYRLESVPGITEGCRLFVKGPNIMLGYLLADKPGELIPPADGWHDTGDIVVIDQNGFITIKDRAKRFAKIGGEMISLTAVENHIAEIWPEYQHAVMSIADPKKGEQLLLITNYKQAAREKIIAQFKRKDISELNIPRQIKIVDALPLLGTGKVDYVALKSWAGLHTE